LRVTLVVSKAAPYCSVVQAAPSGRPVPLLAEAA
jgi:hypothetical protein